MNRFAVVVVSLVAAAVLGCGGAVDVDGEEPNNSPDAVNMSQELYAPGGACTTKAGGCAKWNSATMQMDYGKCTSFSMGGMSGCSCDNGGGSASDCTAGSSVEP